MKEFGILTFQSTHHAMKAERILADEGVITKTIPTPRDITLSCGLSIRVGIDDLETVMGLKESGRLDYKDLHHLQTIDGVRTLKKLD